MIRKKTIFTFILVCFVLGKVLSQALEIPRITNVSVDKNTQKVLINWSMVMPENVDGYIVLRQIFGQDGVVNGTFNTIATINNQSQFSYLDIGSDYGTANPGSRIENYRVASFKKVGGTTEYSNLSDPVSSFLLMPVQFDLCLEQNSLSWTSYHGFGSNIAGYNIYYSDSQSGTSIFISQQASTDTTFIHEHVVSNTLYFYHIEAFSNILSDTSFSNIQEIATTMPPVPLIMTANYGTVEQNNQVDLSFTVDANASVNSYKLLKAASKDGIFDTIASFPRGTAEIDYSDFVRTNQEIAYYKVIAINTCGLKSRESDIAHNIVLEASPDNQGGHSNQLKWNFYEGWNGQVMRYSVFRSVDDGPFEEITSLNSSVNSYTDEISQWIKPEINGKVTKGHFCYYVVAYEAFGNGPGMANQSKSNISCAHQETISYIPNAFNPNSSTEENRIFKPVISFVSDYKLIIYNRWGEIVFQSNNPLQGWDGRNRSGDLLKKGTFVYYLKYRTKDNKLVDKSGQINLVY